VGIRIIISLLFLSLNAMASPHGVSPQRAPGVSWKTLARERQPVPLKNFRTSAIGSSVPLPEVDLNQIPQLNDYVELESTFRHIRDIRFLKDPELPGIQRRSSWLFPDDGCYARASLAIQNVQNHSSITPLKIFAYGNLVAKTANTFEGSVTWWYHVAPIIGAQGNYYVLDPALEPKRPLLLKEWALRLGQSQYISFNVCQPQTYLPYSSCENPPTDEDENALADQLGFLPLERERILELDRNADEELGEHPPWVL
jgi:hypothetical protein